MTAALAEHRVTSGETSFVSLGIENQIYAVPVSSVVEILDMRPVFRIPETPAYLAGLIDFRGRSVPVVDLRLKLGLSAAAVTPHTRILVLEVPIVGRQIVVGLTADRVFEVMPLDLSELEAPPEIGVAWSSDYIQGIGRRGDRFILLIDLARLFSAGEVAMLGRSDVSPEFRHRASDPSMPVDLLFGPEQQVLAPAEAGHF